MSARLLCPSASGPLEVFAVQLDPLLQTLAQWRQGFRIYLSGLPLPHDRSRCANSATDHLARQYLESVGEIDNGSVATTTL